MSRHRIVLSQSGQTPCAHDVAVACCLAMAEVRVRLPLGALGIVLNPAWLLQDRERIPALRGSFCW